MPSMSAGNRVIGVGMEYVNVLDEGQDLVEAAKSLAPPSFRDAEIAAVVEALAKKRSVLLIGPPGVGKTSVLQGVAHRFGDEDGMRLRRFTTAQILSGTRYIGDWQSKLTRLMVEAEQQNAVLNIVDVWNLSTVGATVQSNQNLLDAMLPWLSQGRLRLISEATVEQLQDMHRAARLLTLCEIIRVDELSGEQRREIVARAAAQQQ